MNVHKITISINYHQVFWEDWFINVSFPKKNKLFLFPSSRLAMSREGWYCILISLKPPLKLRMSSFQLMSGSYHNSYLRLQKCFQIYFEVTHIKFRSHMKPKHSQNFESPLLLSLFLLISLLYHYTMVLISMTCVFLKDFSNSNFKIPKLFLFCLFLSHRTNLSVQYHQSCWSSSYI